MTTRGLWILIAIFSFLWASTALGVALQLADRGVGAWWVALLFGAMPLVAVPLLARRGAYRRPAEAIHPSDTTTSTREGVPTRANVAEDLTPREHEVLGLLGEGRTNRQIAEELYVSPATVKSHVNAICRKLLAENRTHAVAIAREQGLLL